MQGTFCPCPDGKHGRKRLSCNTSATLTGTEPVSENKVLVRRVDGHQRHILSDLTLTVLIVHFRVRPMSVHWV